jgi:CheY-like chemotaxis protein
MDGYDPARQFRAQPWGGDMRLVALTGRGQESDRRLSKEAGCDCQLAKPVHLKKARSRSLELAGCRPKGPAQERTRSAPSVTAARRRTSPGAAAQD